MADEKQRMESARAIPSHTNKASGASGTSGVVENSALELVAAPTSARGRMVALLSFCLVAVVLAAIDLVSKSWVFSKHFSADQDFQQPWWLWDGVFGFQVSFNRGALFGIFPGYSWAFAVISFLFIGILLSWLFLFGAWRDRWLALILAMVTGGILGNLYDRLGFGYRPEYPIQFRDSVRDWILFRWEGVPFFDPWPNFNLADSYLVVGALLMLLHSMMQKPSPQSR